MKAAWAEVRRLIAVNAMHIRKGFYVGEADIPFITTQAESEFKELLDAPNDPAEMADLLSILFHYCQKQGWSMEQIEQLMLKKFLVRFDKPKCTKCNGSGSIVTVDCKTCDGKGYV